MIRSWLKLLTMVLGLKKNTFQDYSNGFIEQIKAVTVRSAALVLDLQ